MKSRAIIAPETPPRIVMVGGSFAGVTLAQRLERLLPASTEIVAIAVIYGVKLSGFLAWFLRRGVYPAKLPTFSRKLEVAISWARCIPFPPNIVQLRLPEKPTSEAHRALVKAAL